MSSSPRSRSTQTAIFALAIGAAIIGLSLILLAVGVNVIEEGGAFVGGLYPPIAVTAEGAKIRDLYTVVFLIAVAIFIIVEGLIIWSVIRYRRKPGDVTLPPQTHGNNIAEFVWTIVPTIIVIFMFIVSWQTLNAVDVSSATAQTKIRAVAGQFQWQFQYLPADADAATDPVFTISIPEGPDGGLTLPAGETTHLYLRSPDVIHAFYVPQFLFKRDVIPFQDAHQDNNFDLEIPASDAGQTYRGQCAELCGIGHRIMLFEVHVLAPADFKVWYDKQVAAAKATPPPAPSGAAAGPTLNLVAQGIKFDQATLTGPATGFTIHFDNKDTAGTPHDVDILDGSGAKVVDNTPISAPAVADYPIPPLPAGSYKFQCSIHPTMTGTLTVQ
jgi:cytochrome c oxidase subunit 2